MGVLRRDPTAVRLHRVEVDEDLDVAWAEIADPQGWAPAIEAAAPEGEGASTTLVLVVGTELALPILPDVLVMARRRVQRVVLSGPSPAAGWSGLLVEPDLSRALVGTALLLGAGERLRVLVSSGRMEGLGRAIGRALASREAWEEVDPDERITVPARPPRGRPGT